MKIQIRDYELTQKSEFFSLIYNKSCKKSIIQDGKKILIDEPGRTRPITLGTKLNLEQCLNKIIGHELSLSEETVSLEKYLETYKEQQIKFTEIFNQIFPTR